MIAHVAEAGEDRGRVVLTLGASDRLSDAAMAAAVRIAEAFQSEIEGILIEDRRLFDLADYPFVREVAIKGDGSRPLSISEIDRETRYASTALERRIAATARQSKVKIRTRTVRDEPVAALAAACSASGPWNVVVLGQSVRPGSAGRLQEVFANVIDTTGVVVVGEQARHSVGPVILAVEDLDRLSAMLRAAARLSEATGGATRVLLIADDHEQLMWMDGQARLVVGDTSAGKVDVTGIARSGPASIAEKLRRMRGSFVIAQYGGAVYPSEMNGTPLSSVLECPLLLVR